MRTGNEYLEAAQLSLIDGFPAEAARIIDKGYAAGLLGGGPTLRGTSASRTWRREVSPRTGKA